jgi:hypothetical protein
VSDALREMKPYSSKAGDEKVQSTRATLSEGGGESAGRERREGEDG